MHRNWEALRVTLREVVDAVVDELLQPNENNLIAQGS